MIPYFLLHLKFLLTSNNQHGVHSPFVYGYITKCLYKKAEFKGSKSMQVFHRSRTYFNAKKVGWLHENSTLRKQEEKGFGFTSTSIPPFDLVFIERNAHFKIVDFVLAEGNIQNNTMIVINEIYRSKESRLLWKTLKNMEQVIVTIDMFYCGALFFRKEQVKEHFKIRI